ncbi:MAG: hypothetical protein NTZ17_10590 [Phycisphaerae bacterium]|nr:hypothetical protein [Phycisphaerae bacterium]
MAGKLCVYIRDTQHPADLYDSSTHWYAVSIHEVGSNSPLCWKGVNYSWVWLPFNGEFSRVAGEFEVPAGTYLVKGYAFCSNVVTHVAWVQVNDGEVSSANLVPTTVLFCILAARLGVALGTARVEGKDVPIAKIAGAEVAAFERAVEALAAKLPKEMGMPVMAIEELRKRLSDTPKE